MMLLLYAYDVERQCALRQGFSRGGVEARHSVRIVTNKYKRCRFAQTLPIYRQIQSLRARIPRHPKRRPGRDDPLRRAAGTIAFTQLHDPWIDSHARVVEEHPAVHFTDINTCGMSIDHDLRCSRELERNRQVTGEVIQRAEWQHAKCDVAIDDGVRHGVHCAVTAAGHDGVCP